MRRECGAALGERLPTFASAADSRRGGRGVASLSLSTARPSGRGLQMDIERLFNQKQRFASTVVFTAGSVVEGVLKLVFKTLVECVRLGTFGKYGLQQVQVRRMYRVCAL